MAHGILAQDAGFTLPVQVLKSNAGYYLGTRNSQEHISRESVGYWPTFKLALACLASGQWQQRSHP